MALVEEAVITLNAGENVGSSCVLDPSNTTLYVGLSTTPPQVVKINTNTFTRVGAISLSTPPASSSNSAEITSAEGFVYIGTGLSPDPAAVKKVDLSTFLETASLNLNGVNSLASDIDLTNNILYMSSASALDRIPLDSFTIATTASTAQPHSIAGDFSNNLIYTTLVGFGPSTIVDKRNATTLSLIASITYPTTGTNPDAMVIDTVAQKLYIGNGGDQVLTRIDLASFLVDGTLSLGVGTGVGSGCLVIDQENDFLYIKAIGASSSLIAVRLSTFIIDNTLTLSSGGTPNESGLAGDFTAQILYTSGSESPAKVIKVSTGVSIIQSWHERLASFSGDGEDEEIYGWLD